MKVDLEIGRFIGVTAASKEMFRNERRHPSSQWRSVFALSDL